MKIIDVLIHELLFVISARRNVVKIVDRNVTSCFLKCHDFMTPTRPPLHSSTIFQNILPLWQHLLHRRMFFTIHIVSVAAHLLQVKRPSQCIVSDLQPVLFLSVMNYTEHRRTSFASKEAFTMHCQLSPACLVFIRDELHRTLPHIFCK